MRSLKIILSSSYLHRLISVLLTHVGYILSNTGLTMIFAGTNLDGLRRGFNQEYGIDYGETFSPVIKSLTIRLVLHLAVTNSWQIKKLDVNSAFLQGTLTDEVYVTQPPGFEDPDRPHHVCRLQKALYGLKQAPRAWYQELKTFLCQMGCHNSAADTSVFTYINNNDVLYVLVYVDDIIVTGKHLRSCLRLYQCTCLSLLSQRPDGSRVLLGH